VTFSFNLVLALFLLAPGFAFVMGVYYGGPRTKLEPTPPPPNSLLALALVTSGALAAHLACAGFYAVCELIALAAKASWSLPHPNPYVVALGLNGAADRYREFGLFWAIWLDVGGDDQRKRDRLCGHHPGAGRRGRRL
jgi:hypothetical protein